jgi:hypothetical protein
MNHDSPATRFLNIRWKMLSSFFKLMASLPDDGKIDGPIITLKAHKVHCQPVPIIILIFNAY